MHQRRFLLCLSCLPLLAVGCGESPYAITRDGITGLNELADVAMKIPDDETAEEVASDLYKTHLEPLKDKFESIRKRRERYDKTIVNKQEHQELVRELQTMTPESSAATARVTSQFGPGGRLSQIRTKMIMAEEAKTRMRVADPDKTFPGLTAFMKADKTILGTSAEGPGYLKDLKTLGPAKPGRPPGP